MASRRSRQQATSACMICRGDSRHMLPTHSRGIVQAAVERSVPQARTDRSLAHGPVRDSAQSSFTRGPVEQAREAVKFSAPISF